MNTTDKLKGLSVFCLFCGLLIVMTGCSSSRVQNANKVLNSDDHLLFWKPHLLFIQAHPYPRLYVEIDAIEGMVPDNDTLYNLQNFLALHCVKPGGIEVLRDSVIPREQAQGVAPYELARRHMTGPNWSANTSPSAYLYILFLDTALSQIDSNVTKTPITQTTSNQQIRPIRPHTEILPYPAIIIADPKIHGPLNAPKLSRLFGPILQHEAGHLLGLGRNPCHCTKFHCNDKTCLMFPQYSLGDLLFRELWAGALDSNTVPALQICSKCNEDIQSYKREPCPANVLFVGPVFVRLEEGYQVLALPGRLKLIIGNYDERDAMEFVKFEEVKSLNKNHADGNLHSSWIVKPEFRKDRIQFRKALERAKRDPYQAVRIIASKI